MNQSTKIVIVAIFLILIIGTLGYALSHRASLVPAGAPGVLQVVAGENFWGSIAAQIGGDRVQVTNIVSDPNADPHEYESSTQDARLFSGANYVILSGAGYDSWGDKLLGASTQPDRKVLDVAALLGKKKRDNPHTWYNPAYVNEVALQIKTDYIALDPKDAAQYEQNYQALKASLAVYQDRITSIRQQFAGTKVAATEDIFAYLAAAAGLDLVSPPSFTQAVSEGNDPSAQSLVIFQEQLKSGQVKVLVYNQQTVTPLTESVKKLAVDQGIPVIGITETIQPPGLSFQDWMNSQVTALQDALSSQVRTQ